MKTTTYYAQTELIDALCEHYGHRLERISKEDKFLMIAAIALYHAQPSCIEMQKSGKDFNWVEMVLESIDPEQTCDESVREAIEALLETETERVLKDLMMALAEQISAGTFAKKQ